MTARQAITLMLHGLNTRQQPVGGTFAAFGGTTGSIGILQREANTAISAWHETGHTKPLRQLAATLQAYGSLTDIEYEQIMEALDGE